MVAITDNDAEHGEGEFPRNDLSSERDALLYGTVQDRSETALEPPNAIPPAKKASVSWMSLPNKSQLAVLVTARLSEPLVQTSLQSYMFYQLKSFDRSLPDSVIAGQAGIMQASFKAGQLLTALIWGRVADSELAGRKIVIMIGLLGTFISCVGFGFSTTFWQALLFRIFGGALNGNVAVMRTVISEVVVEKKFQSRAFLLLPMCFNIGSIIGPLLGGVLADPAHQYPDLFGNVQWLIKYPYAAPNLVSGVFMLWSASLVFFGLRETLETISHKEDWGVKCSRKVVQAIASVLRSFRRSKKDEGSHRRAEDIEESQSLLPDNDGSDSPAITNARDARVKKTPRYTQKLPFRRIFTANVVNTLTASAIIGIYMGAFNPLWLIFLSTSVADPAKDTQHPPLVFSGGLGMPPRDVGFAMALLGTIGISLQLFVYPTVTQKLGVIRCWRIFLYCFPIAAVCAPFLALVPSKTPPPAGKDGVAVWLAICAVLMVQVVGRVFVGPATAILINNCSPHPSTLATTHAIAQTVASGVRTIAPVAAGTLYGVSLSYGVVGAVWWGLAGIALYGCLASNWVREGNGHEILLEGDVVIEDEAEA